MALSRDRGTAKQPLDQGYGLVCDLDGRPIPDLIVVDTHQEHGVIAHRSGAKPPRYPSAPACASFPTTPAPLGRSMRGTTWWRGSERF